jgi:hypothetical protein
MENELSPGSLGNISTNDREQKKESSSVVRRFWWQRLTPFIPRRLKDLFLSFDKKVDGAASFFLKHWGKSRFMVSMSKKAQYLGIENLFLKGPKAFIYFFLFYLVRDTILYILIPIIFAQVTSGS